MPSGSRSPSPTRSEVGSDYWDPPCRVCKKVDNEPNVLCELCNGAYHLACIHNVKPPLPRTPEDEEWFCRGCIKRGVPEAIIDRVGRYSAAFYLVKWLGKPSWDVSWEDAATLDTPWSRKLIVAFLQSAHSSLVHSPRQIRLTDRDKSGPCREKEALFPRDAPPPSPRLRQPSPHSASPSACPPDFPPASRSPGGSGAAPRPLLPPCHPLLDRLPKLPAGSEGDATPEKGRETAAGVAAPPPPPRSTDLPPGWTAEKKVTKAGRSYTRYTGPDGRKAESKAAAWRIVERQAAAGACGAGKSNGTGSGAAGEQGSAAAAEAKFCGGAAEASPCGGEAGGLLVDAAEADGACLPYSGYLCHLAEARKKGKAQGTLEAALIERRAAEEWSAMSAARRAPSMQRARKLLSGAEAWPHEAERLRPLDRRPLDDAAGGTGGRKAGGQQGRPCECCGEADGRDAVRCGTCPARRHLMCFFPPLADACEAAGWQCDGCVRAVASGGVLRSLPAVGETIEVDIAEAEAAGGGGAWVAAEVAEHLGEGRFAARYETWRFCASLGDSDEATLEELSMDDEGLDWRRLPPQGAAAAQAARASAEERRSADVAALARDTQPRPSPLLAKVEELYREGYVIADGCIDAVQVETCLDVVEEGFKHYMHSVKQLDLQEELLASGFMEIKMRSAGRYDLQLPELSTEPFSFLLQDAPWMPLVHAALGSDATLTHFGCMLSFPGSATQPWHSDGPHMNAGGDPRFVAPLHAVNVFVPLVNLTAANGPTEYVPGSHFDFDAKVPSKTPSLKAGSALIFDYRLKHRGLGNSGTEERPLLYITYAKPFWLDVYNFDRKRYKNLPAVAKQASRAERTEKRQRTIFGGLP